MADVWLLWARATDASVWLLRAGVRGGTAAGILPPDAGGAAEEQGRPRGVGRARLAAHGRVGTRRRSGASASAPPPPRLGGRGSDAAPGQEGCAGAASRRRAEKARGERRKKRIGAGALRAELLTLEATLRDLAREMEALHEERKAALDAAEARVARREQSVQLFQSPEFLSFALENARQALFLPDGHRRSPACAAER